MLSFWIKGEFKILILLKFGFWNLEFVSDFRSEVEIPTFVGTRFRISDFNKIMWVLIALIIIFWGAVGFVEKLALLSGAPWQTLFAFLFWTALLFSPFAIIMLYKKQGWNGFKISRRVWFWIFFAVITDLLAVSAFRYALLKGPTGIVVAVTAIYPLITVFLSRIFLKEKISKWQYTGVMILCLGLFLLSL